VSAPAGTAKLNSRATAVRILRIFLLRFFTWYHSFVVLRICCVWSLVLPDVVVKLVVVPGHG
jgi:hypothetical protein